MHEIDHANASHHTVFVPAILALDQFNLTGIPFGLDTIIENAEGIWRVVNQRLRKLPDLTSGVALAGEVVRHCIMAGAIKMISKIATGIY